MDRFSSTLKMAKERIREHKGQQISNLKNPEKKEENKKSIKDACVCVCVCVVC